MKSAALMLCELCAGDPADGSGSHAYDCPANPSRRQSSGARHRRLWAAMKREARRHGVSVRAMVLMRRETL